LTAFHWHNSKTYLEQLHRVHLCFRSDRSPSFGNSSWPTYGVYLHGCKTTRQYRISCSI